MNTQKRNRGFTLIELIVAMSLGLVLTGGMYSIFNENARTANLVQANSRVQENARFALSELVTFSRMIGYMGCLSTLDMGGTDFVNTLNVGAGDPIYDPTRGQLELYSIDSSGNGLPADIAALITPAADTDVLVVRGLSTQSYNLNASMPDTSADLPLSGVGDMAIDDIVFLSDCEKAALFQITNMNLQPGTGNTNVVHNTGGGSPGNSTKQLSSSDPFAEDASVQKFMTNMFFIAPAPFTNSSGDQVLSLWQKMGSLAPFELVSGIESLMVWAGEDADGDGAPDRIVRPGDVTDTDNVVSVDLIVRANSIDPYEGDLLRRDFAASVKIRNRGL